LKAKYDSRQGEVIIEDGEIQEPQADEGMMGDLGGMPPEENNDLDRPDDVDPDNKEVSIDK